MQNQSTAATQMNSSADKLQTLDIPYFKSNRQMAEDTMKIYQESSNTTVTKPNRDGNFRLTHSFQVEVQNMGHDMIAVLNSNVYQDSFAAIVSSANCKVLGTTKFEPVVEKVQILA